MDKIFAEFFQVLEQFPSPQVNSLHKKWSFALLTILKTAVWPYLLEKSLMENFVQCLEPDNYHKKVNTRLALQVAERVKS